MFTHDKPAARLPDPRRIALVGNYTPQRCGLATFTADTRNAFATHDSDPIVDTYIMHDEDSLKYPPEVTELIGRNRQKDYGRAAGRINASGADILFLQHEFGIFGGPDGEFILDLIEGVTIPVAVMFHTVLEYPTPQQDAIMRRLIASAQILIVMAEYGRTILKRRYDLSHERIVVVPHGIPDFAYTDPDDAKAQFGIAGRQVIMTFGLLSHDKGIEWMIEAMPAIVDASPDILYVILGATHPNLVAKEGEALRERLQQRAIELGVASHIQWIDAFVELKELVEYLKATDVYVTPYLNPMQITSGTLSYAVGMGKPVVSTPYIHASELLVRGNGVIVPFRDSTALAREIGGLLHDDKRRKTMARIAFERGRAMTWNRYAQAILARFDTMITKRECDETGQFATATAA